MVEDQERKPQLVTVLAALATSTLLCTEALAQDAKAPTDASVKTEPPVQVAPRPPAWELGQPVPSGYHVERKINRGLIAGGAVVFAVAYVSIVIPTLIIQNNDAPLPGAPLVILPVGGAFVLMAPLVSASGGQNPNGIVIGLVVLDVLVQAAGAGMLIGGIVGKPVLAPGPPRRGAAQVFPVPVRLGSNGAGIGIAGTW
jgi:hypothetical protein